jgi:hypothetical protein
MDKEQRKEYYKTYYANNKERIINKALEKIECDFCHRVVTKGNILKHYETAICKRRMWRFLNTLVNYKKHS